MRLGRIHMPAAGGYDAGYDDIFASNFDPHLRLTVIHTTTEGTLCALKLANRLVKDLSARIRLVATEVVPFRLPLEYPMISTNFLRQRQTRLVEEAGLEADTVSIEICLCREPKKALREYLPPGSLVIIGGKKLWWRVEQRWAKWLGRAGHQVVFAEVKRAEATICKFSQAIPSHRSLKYPDIVR